MSDQLQHKFTTVYHMVSNYNTNKQESERRYNDYPMDIDPVMDKWVVRITKVCQTSILNTLNCELRSLFTTDHDLEKPQVFCVMVREPIQRLSSIINHAHRELRWQWGLVPPGYNHFAFLSKTINVHSTPQFCLIPFRKDSELYNIILSRLDELCERYDEKGLSEHMDWDYVLKDLDIISSIINGPDHYKFYKMKGTNAVNDFFIDCVGVDPELLEKAYRRDNHYDNTTDFVGNVSNFAKWCDQQKFFRADTALWRLAS